MRGSRTTPRQVFSLALVAAACSLMLAACGREAETEAVPPPRPVRITTVEKREASTPLTFTDRIEAQDEVSVAFRISGRLLAIDTKIGDRVEASCM
jgi:multidrug efflux pump subunit AcrA (membrane-fusion protein)